MNKYIREFVNFIIANSAVNTKEALIEKVRDSFELVKDGKALYHCSYFAVVFCYSQRKSFSNVILSLSKLQKYDHIPCFVVWIKRDMENQIFMINSTFIDKISHSSQNLRINNIKGSFLGSNIRKDITEINKRNIPENFDVLFAYHESFTWYDNLLRIVERTSDIKPKVKKVVLNDTELDFLYQSPNRAKQFINSKDYDELLNDLQERCNEVIDALFVAAHIENVNIRGRLIEILITSDPAQRRKLLQDIKEINDLLPVYDTKNDLGDYVRSFPNSNTFTDVKTKIVYKDSFPKAYNIDKFLKCMGEDKSVFMFFFVGIDEEGLTNTRLCSVYDTRLLGATILQQHWAGRERRGTAQFNGKVINQLLTKQGFVNEINLDESKDFIDTLLKR